MVGLYGLSVMLWLGKAVYAGHERCISFFHMGTAEEPPNSARPLLNRVLWKLLAEHARHTLRVVTDQDPSTSGWKTTSRSEVTRIVIETLRRMSRAGLDE